MEWSGKKIRATNNFALQVTDIFVYQPNPPFW